MGAFDLSDSPRMPQQQQIFLDPKRKLVDEVVDWLCGSDAYQSHVRDDNGARSLAHMMVVVPTAQSGRNLRLGLAKKAAELQLGGLLPPRIVMPNQLLVPAGVRVATEAEELAVMASVLPECEIGKYHALFPKPPSERTTDWALDMAGIILGIESILGECALPMSQVKPELDLERWRDLADIENKFFEALRTKGVVPRGVARRDAIASGCREKGIEEIVLPSAVDVQGAFVGYLQNSSQCVHILVHADESDADKFDVWGRPKTVFAANLGPEMIETAPTAVVEADDIARYFRNVKPEEALPALAVCDAEMYPELEGAFQNYFSEDELVLRNPSKEKLLNSSLGRLLGAIVQLGADRDYETFSTLVRTGDIARWARGALAGEDGRPMSAGEVAMCIGALDAVQNAHLPRTIDEVVSGAEADSRTARREEERKAAAGLKRLAEAVKAELVDPFRFLQKIFSSVTLDEKNPGDRELIAAAKTIRELREACESPVIPERYRRQLFAQLLKSATYMLEPLADNVLATTGWLEVPWCLDDELVIAGFNEGCVPENVVGHPFVPDALRRALGITTNAVREMRDSFIFAQAVRCRPKGAVAVRLHQISGDRNVMKPSRILFPGICDKDLPDLALRLYAVTKGSEGAPAKELPPAWRLKLPFPPKGTVFREKISPTELDQYLRCPFNFYLREVFGEHADDRNQELDARTFGTLCHEALDQFAKNGPKDSTNADEIARFLSDEVHRQLQVFGEPLPAIIELQGEAAIERLTAFSAHQAARRRAGWRIVCSEQKLKCQIKGCPTVLSGKVDRIDQHDVTGEIAIIDYKTWNRAKEENYNSLQLPIYRAMVETAGIFDPAKAHSSKAFYCILAERAEDTLFDEDHAYHEGLQSQAEDQIVGLLVNIAKGMFYPPKPASGGGGWVWQKDYSSLIWESPETGVDPEWLRDQASRKEVSE